MGIIKTAFFAISQTLSKLIAGFLVIKLVAVLSGPEGVAKFGTYQNFMTILLMLSGGIVLTGVTSTISSSLNSKTESEIEYTNAFQYTKQLALLSLVIVLPLCLIIQYYIIGDKSIDGIVLLLCSAPFVYLQSRFTFHLAVLNAVNKIDRLAWRNIQSSLLVLFFSFLVYSVSSRWELAAITLCLSPGILYLYIKIRRLDNFFPGYQPLHKLDRTKLNHFALAGLASAICMPIAQIYIRTTISEALSGVDAGIWQGLSRLSEVYLVLISSVLSIYIIPRMAAAKTRLDIRKIIVPITLFAIPCGLVSVFFVYLLRDIFIYVLFDSRFLSMSDYFIYQLPGDLIKIISWIFSFSLLAQGHTRIVMSLEIFSTLIYVFLSKLLLTYYGLSGVVIAYTINYILYFIMIFSAFLFWYKRYD